MTKEDLIQIARMLKENAADKYKCPETGEEFWVIPIKSEGCGAKLAKGQWFETCGQSDMGSLPALCEQCGGKYKLDEK